MPPFFSPPRGAHQSNPWVQKTLFSTEFLSKPSKDFIGRRGFLVGKDAMDVGVFAAKVQIRAAFKKVVNGLVVFEFFDMLLLRFVFQKTMYMYNSQESERVYHICTYWCVHIMMIMRRCFYVKPTWDNDLTSL